MAAGKEKEFEKTMKASRAAAGEVNETGKLSVYGFKRRKLIELSSREMRKGWKKRF